MTSGHPAPRFPVRARTISVSAAKCFPVPLRWGRYTGSPMAPDPHWAARVRHRHCASQSFPHPRRRTGHRLIQHTAARSTGKVFTQFAVLFLRAFKTWFLSPRGVQHLGQRTLFSSSIYFTAFSPGNQFITSSENSARSLSALCLWASH